MSKNNETLAEIARNHLGIETIETRNRDALDFHEVAVWKIKQALDAAFEAGLAAAKERNRESGKRPRR